MLKLTTLNGTKTTMKDTGWTSGWTSFLPYRTFTGNSRYLGDKAATGQVTLDQIRPEARGSTRSARRPGRPGGPA